MDILVLFVLMGIASVIGIWLGVRPVGQALITATFSVLYGMFRGEGPGMLMFRFAFVGFFCAILFTFIERVTDRSKSS